MSNLHSPPASAHLPWQARGRPELLPGRVGHSGGHCEPGESLEHALVREVEEELGVTPTVWAPLAVLHGSGPACERYELHVFVVNSWCGTPRNRLPEEHDEVAWLTVDDACALALAHPDYPALFRAAFCPACD